MHPRNRYASSSSSVSPSRLLPPPPSAMEARDSAHALGLQMQAFYEHCRASGGAFPPYQPSPLQLQQPSPHQHQHQHQHPSPQQYFPPPLHLHYQHQQQQQREHHHHEQQQHHHNHHQHELQQHQHQHQHQHQQLNASRNSHSPSSIHSPASLRQLNPNSGLNLNPNPNPNLSPVTNLNPNSSSAVSACYPPETPPHMMPHQLQAASSSPPSVVGMNMSMSPGSAMVPMPAPTFKKKRGRPRKYAPDGNGAAALVVPLNSAPPAEKKGSRVSTKKAQISTSGTAGHGFTPHVLTVGAGEDITAKIMTFSQHGPWAVCILSANGAISNASLWHSGVSSGIVTYEGRFEILSLSGLFLLTGDGAARSRSGGFSVSLAGQDGRVIGGRVAGLLVAATPIQVVIGTFFQENRKSKAKAVNVEGASHAPTDDETRQAPMAMPDGTQLETSGSVQGRGLEEAVKEEQRVSHATPLQSTDWGFDMEARSHNEQI